jgi:hypothetical protein
MWTSGSGWNSLGVLLNFLLLGFIKDFFLLRRLMMGFGVDVLLMDFVGGQ